MRTVFDIAEKSSKFFLEISTLSDKVSIIGGRSFIYIMKNKGPKIDPWGTPRFTVAHFEKNFSKDFISVFCFLFVR